MLRVFFKSLPVAEVVSGFSYIDERRLVPVDKLTAETALYWKTIVLHLMEQDEDSLDDFLPELSAFCHYVRYFMTAPDCCKDKVLWLFISRQLVEMMKAFDLSDEVRFQC